MPKFKTLKGFKDILPEEAALWEWVESVAKSTFDTYGFLPIQTPLLEVSGLFTQSLGAITDIVEKELYTFEDKDTKRISLRPEGTASVVRAYLEHSSLSSLPCAKLYYVGPMFRHERPQAGRLRQFHQMGVESIGEMAPERDVEILVLLSRLFRQLQIADLTLLLNSLGCSLCRSPHRNELMRYLSHRIDPLCEACVRRLTTNPLRILDCKRERCQEVTRQAPSSLDYLCTECSLHFKAVKEGLTQRGVVYQVHRHLVRGIDYYTKTAFEITTERLGAQNAVAAGGRYDNLVELLGGPKTPAVGAAIGMERLVRLISWDRIPSKTILKRPLALFMVPLGASAYQFLLPKLDALREKGIKSEIGDGNSRLKNQMRQADSQGAQYVLIVGEDELQEGQGILRNMTTHEQSKVSLACLVQEVTRRLGTSP